jgi:transcriptional regulator with XRE-family HTH domain
METAGLTALEVGRALARMRARAGITQAELARAMGTSQPAVSRAERGRQMPTVAFLERYAWAAGRLLSIDIGPPARQRGVRWATVAPGTRPSAEEVLDPVAEAAGRIRRVRERVDRGELPPAEYAMQALNAELELAEKLEGRI